MLTLKKNIQGHMQGCASGTHTQLYANVETFPLKYLGGKFSIQLEMVLIAIRY